MMSQRIAPLFDLAGKRVWVAGHRGLVGSALVRRLERERCEIITVGRDRLDLRRQSDVEDWVAETRPDAVFLAAATVGGIYANVSRPSDFLYNNLAIATNVIEASRRAQVKKFLFLGSSCIYPRLAPQPIPEDALLSGPLEPTNQWYAMAKISGIMMCRAYRKQYGVDFNSAMPTNLYGPGDNFDLETSHVIPALMAKAHAARMNGADELVVWGTGAPLREFLHVDDLADGLVFVMQHYSSDDHINVGAGSDVTIRNLAEMIARVVGFRGSLRFDAAMPDGTPRKLLDTARIRSLGWQPTIPLEDGLRQTYEWYLREVAPRQARAS